MTETETLEHKKSLAELFRRIHMIEVWERDMPLIMSNEPEVGLREVASLLIANFAQPSHLQTALNHDEPVSTVDKTAEKTDDKPSLTKRSKRYPNNNLQRPGVEKMGAWLLLMSTSDIRRHDATAQKTQVDRSVLVAPKSCDK